MYLFDILQHITYKACVFHQLYKVLQSIWDTHWFSDQSPTIAKELCNKLGLKHLDTENISSVAQESIADCMHLYIKPIVQYRVDINWRILLCNYDIYCKTYSFLW